MRIGFDAKRLFLNNRGLGNYARNLLYGLVKHYTDNELFLYTPSISNEYVSPALLNSANVQVKTPQGIANSISSYWRSYKLGSVSKMDKLDIFHGLAQELPRDIKKSPAKSAVTIHDMIFLQHPEFYKPIDRWIYYNKVKFAVQNAEKIIAISNRTKYDLIEEFSVPEDKISVVYQSCNEVFYERRSVHEIDNVKKKWRLPEQFILYVGALNDNKNILIILKALKILSGQLDLPLVVVGHGDKYKKKLVDYAVENNLKKKLLFASEIADPSPSELSVFYQQASAFVFPSFYEGFGIPILEARFSNTSVIASNSSCLDEAGGEHSRYFDPNNADELAEKLIETLNQTEYNRGNIDDYRIEVSTRKLLEIYSKISLNE